MEHTHQPVDNRQVWFGLGFGVIVWAIHLTTVYAIQSISCHWGFLQYNILGISALRLVLLVITVLAGAGIATSLWVAYRNYRRLREDRAGERGYPEERYLFMTEGGALLNGLCFLAVIFSLVPILLLPQCTPFWW